MPTSTLIEATLLEEGCPSWQTLLAWTEDDLPVATSRWIAAHLDGCPECVARLRFMGAVGEAVGEGAVGTVAQGSSEAVPSGPVVPRPFEVYPLARPSRGGAVETGSKLGHFEILEPLGAGW